MNRKNSKEYLEAWTRRQRAMPRDCYATAMLLLAGLPGHEGKRLLIAIELTPRFGKEEIRNACSG